MAEIAVNVKWPNTMGEVTIRCWQKGWDLATAG